MGQNLARLFSTLVELDDATIKSVHPAHSRETIAALLPRFHYFEQGNCVVHHMFGAEVATRVARDYYATGDVDVTAHLEVPGEMFAIALEAQRHGRGVVGSTKNILDHIVARVDAAIARHTGGSSERLRFVLGTEAGMVTSIVRAIRKRLTDHARDGRDHDVEVEIIFPVAAEAVATTHDQMLPIIPGVSGGEGCSTAGGCATCPFMKMNSLDALCDLLERLPVRGSSEAEVMASRRELAQFEPEKYRETIAGQTVAALGTKPILHMREFQRGKALSAELLADMHSR
jgi:quinolinate synthase